MLEAVREKKLYIRDLIEIGKWIVKSLNNRGAGPTAINEQISATQNSYKQFETELRIKMNQLKQALLSTHFDVRSQ